MRNLTNQQIDNIFTHACLVVGFILVILIASQSIDFQKRCDAACGSAPAMTPVIDFHEQCLCSEGNGRWRKEQIDESR
jgi:hypothetical protein